jgi:hypothetical protein
MEKRNNMHLAEIELLIPGHPFVTYMTIFLYVAGIVSPDERRSW